MTDFLKFSLDVRPLQRVFIALTTATLAACASVTPPEGQATRGLERSESSLAAEANAQVADPVVAEANQPVATTPSPIGNTTGTPEPTAERFSANDLLWDRIRAGFAMPELQDSYVASHERYYLSKPDFLKRVFERGGKYLYHIVEELDRRGMPAEIALLPIVESAFNPKALSSAQAAGLWQFIPSTGRQYNLKQTWWSDHRRDVIDSTSAALEYLQRIYELNNRDWFLALASYNWGEGNVGKAVRRAQTKGLSGEYTSLDMPQETRHYVPKLIALRNILRRMSNEELQLPAVYNRPYFVAVEKTRSIDLKLAAQFAGMSVDEFIALNPAHNRPVISASRHNRIIVPADRSASFAANIEQHAAAHKPLATWKPYTLQKGESLEAVANKSGLSVAELKSANSLKPVGKVIDGTTLLAPIAEQQDEQALANFVAPRLVEQVQTKAGFHTVGKRETLASIADHYDVSVSLLKAWNGMRDSVKRGMRLMVRPSGTQTVLTDEQGQRQVLATVRGVSADVDQERPTVMTATAAASQLIRAKSNATATEADNSRRPVLRLASTRAAPVEKRVSPRSLRPVTTTTTVGSHRINKASETKTAAKTKSSRKS